MALRGNLRDFSLPDVFQLVTFSRKTGVLRIKREDDAEGSVWFRDGDVFFASSNWHSELLGDRLVKAQRITKQALEKALALRAKEPESGRRLGEILIDEGYLTEPVLEAFVSGQIQDTIFDLMRWDEGEFDFEAMPEVVDEDIGLTVSIENVVMEGARRLEEWSRIKKKIPSTDVVFKMATAPGEGTFEISLKPIEWQLLLLFDGSRSVADLARATGRTDFEVARIVYGLFSAGLLEFATEEEIEQARAERLEREARLAEIEAERKKRDEAARAVEIAREAKLAEEAERRREAAEVAAAAATAATAAAEPVAPATVPSEPAEVPEFLGGARLTPTAEDQAVLEAFMGAVLSQPVPETPVAPQPEVVRAPYVPAEEPAFMAVEHTDDSESTLVVPVPLVEGLLPDVMQVPVVSETPPEPVVEVQAEIPVVEIPEPQLEPVPAVESLGEVAGEVASAEEALPDLERDLMALGLGELPSAELVGAEVSVGEGPVVESVAEVVALPTSEPEDLAALMADLSLVGGSVDAAEPVVVESADFSALIESLDVDAAELAAAAEVSPIEAGFDAELLLSDETPAAEHAVISTDAYLEDIGVGGFDFSGGLTDELSALTGAERRRPSRPQASVKPIPDESAGMLKRDSRVDKDTVMKIIDGIKNL